MPALGVQRLRQRLGQPGQRGGAVFAYHHG
jgi:hypothetical protein